jgi:hypothetical protein
MARVKGRVKVSSPNGRIRLPIRDGDDPQTLVGLIYRLTGDPVRALILIGLLMAVVGLWILLSLTGPTAVLVSVVGSVSVALLVIRFAVRRISREQRKIDPPAPPDTPTS